jgi:hypothetical protein
MVKFVCYSQPVTDAAEVLSHLTGEDSLQHGDQSNISCFDACFKKIENWKAETDKTIKKFVEKHDI